MARGNRCWTNGAGGRTCGSDSGAFDLQTVTLNEMGHVNILGHHDNPAYGDAVVQANPTTYPNTNWQMRAFRWADTGRLNLIYGQDCPVPPSVGSQLMNHPRRALAGSLLLAITLAGCGSTDRGTSGTRAAPSPTAAEPTVALSTQTRVWGGFAVSIPYGSFAEWARDATRGLTGGVAIVRIVGEGQRVRPGQPTGDAAPDL